MLICIDVSVLFSLLIAFVKSTDIINGAIKNDINFLLLLCYISTDFYIMFLSDIILEHFYRV